MPNRAVASFATFAAGLAVAFCGCIPQGPKAATTTAPSPNAPGVRVTADHPPVAILAREGDPRGALAVAVSTEGIEPAQGAAVSVALAALTLARLEASGVHGASATPGWDGYRVRVLLEDADAGRSAADAVRVAMTTPLSSQAPELDVVRRKLDALAHRPMADRALTDAAQCTGQPFAEPGAAAIAIDAPRLEAWRQAAQGKARVALAIVGTRAMTEDVARSIAGGPPWPALAVGQEDASAVGLGDPGARAARAGDEGLAVYAATDLAPGAARATLAFHVAAAGRAVLAAQALGDPDGALVTRLGGLESPPRVRDVTATARVGGGCLALTLEFPAKDASDGASRIATAVALVRQEALTEIEGAIDVPDLGRRSAEQAGDPGEAAERAAWWTLVSHAGAMPRAQSSRVSVAVGVAPPRDPGGRLDAASLPAAPRDRLTAGLSEGSIRAALDRATIAWHEPVVDARSRVEAGQGQLWILLASPCGTLPEAEGDAGLGAVVALATAERAPLEVRGAGVTAAGWAAPDGIGLIVHGPALPGESPAAHARRLADAAARSFAASPLDDAAVARARATLLSQASSDEATRAFTTLAEALAPSHPSWIAPLGTAEALGRSSDAAVAARAFALRSGPLRVAVLADVDAGQSEAAVRAIDRWVARRPGEARACPAVARVTARPGTYPAETAGASSSEAWLAFALPPADAEAARDARLLAAALDGDGGLLAKRLGDGGLARAWAARVVGPPGSPALVVRITSVQGALDAAVAETRAILARLHASGLSEDERSRAIAHLAAEDLARDLDPKNRLVALFRSERDETPAPPPTLEALRSFASRTLGDDALFIVAARPPRERDRHTSGPAPAGGSGRAP